MKSNIKKYLSQIISFAIILLLFTIIGGSVGMILSDKFGKELSDVCLLLRLFEFFFIFFAIVFVQIIIHEGGHLVAALMRGWKFLSFMILNLMISRRDGKLHVSRFGIPGAGGQCLMIPPADNDTDFGLAFYNAGGIIANAVTGVISALILYAFYDSISYEAVSFFLSSAYVGIIFAFMNGIPTTMGGLANDGKNIKELRKDRFSTKVFYVSMRFIADMQQGRDIDDAVKEYLCDDRDINLSNPIHAMALNLDLGIAMARTDFAKAAAITYRAVDEGSGMIEIYKNEFKMEQVFLSLVYPGYKYDAGSVLTPGVRSTINRQKKIRPDVLRIEYSVQLLHEHDEEKAARTYKCFKKMCRTYHSRGDVYYQTRLIELVRDTYEKQKTSQDVKQ